MVKASLSNRKRTHQLGTEASQTDSKKEALLAMKLSEVNEQAKSQGELIHLPLDHIRPDPNQPRKAFRNIEALADSIKANGVIQPVIVTGPDDQGVYTLVAGERRYRAAVSAGLDKLPCIRRTPGDTDALIIQLLENDQREKVSPFEEADALSALIHHKKLSKQEVARSLGRDNAWVSMRLKLKQASAAVRTLGESEAIDDVRTLYELQKFEDEMPEPAREFMNKIRRQRISGSYRTAIARAREHSRRRDSKEDHSPRQQQARAIHYEAGTLMIEMAGQSRPLHVRLTPEQVKVLREAMN